MRRPYFARSDYKFRIGPRATAPGELDCSSAPELRQRIHQVLAAGTTIVELDLAGVSFIDAAGGGVLIGSGRHLRELGGQLHLQRIPRPVQRVFEVVGLTALLQVPGTAQRACR